MSSDYIPIGDPPSDNLFISPHFDPHTPKGWTIQSGGGIANGFGGGGYYGGPYSSRSSRSDIYGESMPFLDIGFKDATRGDMYDGTGLEKMRPFSDEDYSQMVEPPYGKPQGSDIDYPYGYNVLYTGNTSPYVQPDATINAEAYEMIASPDIGIEGYEHSSHDDSRDKESERRAKLHPLLVFFILVVLFLTIDIWTQAGNYFIKKHVLKGRKPGKWTYITMAVVATILLWLLTFFSGISITWFERSQG